MFAFLPARARDVGDEVGHEVEGPLEALASLGFAEAESVLERDAAEEAGLLTPSDGGGHGRAEGSLQPASGPTEADLPN